jgi:hypothetical protein
MGINSVAFRTAQYLVGRYGAEADAIIARNDTATECHDGEDFVQLGIAAFEWTQRATKEFRSRSIHEVDSFAEGTRALRELRDAWVSLATLVLAWANKQSRFRSSVNNLAQLEAYLDQMRRIVSEEDKLAAIAKRVPTADALATIAIDPPREWLDEPSWTND